MDNRITDWIETSKQLPPNDVTVDTKIDDEKYGERNHQHLCRQGNLWFFQDKSMYVYYTPTHWGR